jgi:adenylyl-sulfate kinase
MPTPGHVFWIFGLSGAGKSTVASALIADLRSRQVPVLALDGDVLRTGLCTGLGFSDGDRRENLRRAANVAQIATESGLCVVASFITPLDAHRRLIREIIGPDRISFVFADAPLAVCRERDVKGLYALAQAGQVPHMTGLGSSFEVPANADLVLPTANEAAATSVQKLVEFALGRLRT